MSENYIVINGKKTELTEEQMKALGIEKKFESPFADLSEKYVRIITPYGTDIVPNAPYLVNTGRAFKQKEEDFAHQFALHELLYRLLLKYAYDTNTINRSEWNGNNEHFTIIKNESGFYGVRVWRFEKMMNAVYFDTSKNAMKAIDAIIYPFEKEHPEFIW